MNAKKKGKIVLDQKDLVFMRENGIGKSDSKEARREKYINKKRDL